MKTITIIFICVCGFLTNISAQSWVDVKGGVDGSITEMIEYNGKLVVVGNFIYAGGIYSPHMAFWDGTSWLAAGMDSLSNIPKNLVVNNDTLFSTYYNELKFWNGTGWSIYLSLFTSPDNIISFHNEIYFGSGGMLLYRITNDTILMIGQMSSSIHDMTIYQDQLFVTGCFNYINGSRYGHIASYDGTSWHLVDNGFTSSSNGSSLEIFKNTLYIGGDLAPYLNNNGYYNLFTFEGLSLQLAPEQPDYSVLEMESLSENIFINKVHYDQSIYHYTIALLDSISWSDIGEIESPHLNYYILNPFLKEYNNKLYVAGDFSQINGTAFNNIARWDESNGINPNEFTANKQITISPNPANDVVSINMPSTITQLPIELTINDINGKQLQKQSLDYKNQLIYIGNLPIGIYIVKASNEKEVFVGKLIKQ